MSLTGDNRNKFWDNNSKLLGHKRRNSSSALFNYNLTEPLFLASKFKNLSKLHSDSSVLGLNAVSKPSLPRGTLFRSSLPATPLSTPLYTSILHQFTEKAIHELLLSKSSTPKIVKNSDDLENLDESKESIKKNFLDFKDDATIITRATMANRPKTLELKNKIKTELLNENNQNEASNIENELSFKEENKRSLSSFYYSIKEEQEETETDLVNSEKTVTDNETTLEFKNDITAEAKNNTATDLNKENSQLGEKQNNLENKNESQIENDLKTENELKTENVLNTEIELKTNNVSKTENELKNFSQTSTQNQSESQNQKSNDTNGTIVLDDSSIEIVEEINNSEKKKIVENTNQLKNLNLTENLENKSFTPMSNRYNGYNKNYKPNTFGQQQNCLFVGNIHSSVNDDELREYFSTFGSVIKTKIIINPLTKISKSFGFVTFSNTSDVKKILSLSENTFKLKGRFLQISLARNRV